MIFGTPEIQGKLLKKVVIIAGVAVLGLTAVNLYFQIKLNRQKLAEQR